MLSRSCFSVLPVVLTGCLTSGSPATVAAPGRSPICRLEQVTNAAPGENHFQFNGLTRDGNRLAVGWSRDSVGGAYILDLRSRNSEPLPDLTNSGAFSPDGRRVLIANREPDGNRELVEYDLATGSRLILAPDSAAEFLATYSRDGRRVFFNSNRSGRSDLFELDRMTGSVRRLTSFDGYDAHAQLSPDERSILFHRRIAVDDYDVVLLDLATGSERTFVGGPGEQAYPAWSPNGQHVVFASDSATARGRLDLYVTDLERSRTVRLTHAPGYNAYPTWSADGRWLYFNAERMGQRNVFRIRLTAPLSCANQ